MNGFIRFLIWAIAFAIVLFISLTLWTNFITPAYTPIVDGVKNWLSDYIGVPILFIIILIQLIYNLLPIILLLPVSILLYLIIARPYI